MSNKKAFESDSWSEWTCATCHCSHNDPDSIKATTCANGHTTYADSQSETLSEGIKRTHQRSQETRKIWNDALRGISALSLHLEKIGDKRNMYIANQAWHKLWDLNV